MEMLLQYVKFLVLWWYKNTHPVLMAGNYVIFIDIYRICPTMDLLAIVMWNYFDVNFL